jgi:hypothetical protein
MPAAITLWVGSPVMSAPSNVIRPARGGVRPASGFRLAPDGASEEVGRLVLELGGGKQPWGPVEASAERIYDRTDASDDEDRTLEIRVSINGTKGLSTGLASVGGTPGPFTLAGAFALEQTLIGVDDAEGGSRVAMPVDKSQAERTVALLRIYIVPKALEDRLRATAKGSDDLPAFDSSFVPSSKRQGEFPQRAYLERVCIGKPGSFSCRQKQPRRGSPVRSIVAWHQA